MVSWNNFVSIDQLIDNELFSFPLILCNSLLFFHFYAASATVDDATTQPVAHEEEAVVVNGVVMVQVVAVVKVEVMFAKVKVQVMKSVELLNEPTATF
jgi:hypothetical protein